MPRSVQAIVFICVCLALLLLAAARFTGQSASQQSGGVEQSIAQAESEAIERVQGPVEDGESTPIDQVTPTLVAGDAAPAFTLPGRTAEGAKDEISLADYEGEPLVVEFIATWCPHCRAMAPRFAQVMGANPEVGYLVVGSADEPKRKVIAWHQNFLGEPMPGDLAFDPDLETIRAYGGLGYPTVAFINAQGEIESVSSGEMSEEQLQSKVESLADESS